MLRLKKRRSTTHEEKSKLRKSEIKYNQIDKNVSWRSNHAVQILLSVVVNFLGGDIFFILSIHMAANVRY